MSSELATGKKAAAVKAVNDYVQVNLYLCYKNNTLCRLTQICFLLFRTIRGLESEVEAQLYLQWKD